MSASAMTYDSLRKDVQAYAERHDAEFIAQIPRLIMLAENDIAKKVRALGLMKVVKGMMTQSTNIIPKPSRWHETVSFNITFGVRRRILHLRSYEFIRSVCPDESIEEAPRYYADYNKDHLFIGPTPNRNYEFELLYYERPEPLAEDRQTNWITREAPELILYGTLVQAQPFLKNDQRTALFAAMYQQAIDGVENEAERRAADRSAMIREE